MGIIVNHNLKKMIKPTTILIVLLIFSNLMLGQKNEEELKQYKQFLPHIIKNLHKVENDSNTEKLNYKVASLFNEPWEVEKLDEEATKKTITAIVENYRLNIEQDYRKKWNLNFFSTINKNSAIEDTSNSDNILSNTFISISQIELLDENNNSAIAKEERKIKINQATDLQFYNAGIHVDFPLEKEYKNIKGSIKLTLKEFKTIDYKAFKKTDKAVLFNLGDINGIKLLKIEKNKAYFYLPIPIKNIKIASTNNENKVFTENAQMPLPESVYNFGIKEGLNNDLIKSFVKKITLDDVNNNSQILIYQTNGTIENLYIYLKSNPIDLISRTIKINL